MKVKVFFNVENFNAVVSGEKPHTTPVGSAMVGDGNFLTLFCATDKNNDNAIRYAKNGTVILNVVEKKKKTVAG
jgi:hypothetical protein